MRPDLRVAALFQLVALTVACLVVWMAWSMAGDLREELARARHARDTEVGVVVAAREIVPGHTLVPEDLAAVGYPAEYVPDKALVHADVLVGRVARERILPGELFRDERLARPETGAGLNAIIPSGMRALSVNIDGASSVSGFVVPGNRVDVIVTLLEGDEVLETVTLLDGVEVLAVDDRIHEGRRRGVKLKPQVTLALSPAEAERVTHVVQTALLRLSLRGDADYARYGQRGTVTANLLGTPPAAADWD